MRRLVALAALVVLAGCGSERGAIKAGGRVVGDNVTLYSSLPDPTTGVGRDMVDAQKLAIEQARGRIGKLGINFVSVDEGSPGADTPPVVAGNAAEAVIRDPQVIGVVGALRSDTAITSLPLFATPPASCWSAPAPAMRASRSRSRPASPSSGTRRPTRPSPA